LSHIGDYLPNERSDDILSHKNVNVASGSNEETLGEMLLIRMAPIMYDMAFARGDPSIGDSDNQDIQKKYDFAVKVATMVQRIYLKKKKKKKKKKAKCLLVGQAGSGIAGRARRGDWRQSGNKKTPQISRF
jgi:hypothetical protein